jgi:hypothetical protein
MSDENALILFQEHLQRILGEQTDSQLGTGSKLRRVIKKFRPIEIRAAVAMFYAKNRKVVTKQLEITSREMTPQFWDRVNELLDFLKAEHVANAMALLEYHVVEAVAVKAQGLKSHNERERQRAATEILDRVYGKPTSRSTETQQSGGDTYIFVDGLDPSVWDQDKDKGEIIEGSFSE